MSEEKVRDDVQLDDILEKLGTFGRHQVVTILLTSFSFIVNSIYCVNYIFSAEDIPYRCEIEQCESAGNFTLSPEWYNFTAPTDEYRKCHRYEYMPLSNILTCTPDNFNNSQITNCERWIYAKNDSFISEFELACEDWKRTMVGTVRSFGLMIGLIIQGQLSDRFGRKAAICIAGITGGVLGLAKSYTKTYTLFIFLEFLEAAFGDVCSPSFILSIESVHSKDRLMYQAVLSIFYSLGGVIMAAVAWWLPYWRHYLRAIYGPSLLFVFYFFFLNESVRWLLSKGRKEEAKNILINAAKTNKIILDEKVLMNLNCESEKEAKKSPLLETFRSKIVVKRFLICIIWWTTCSFIFFGLMINSVLLQGNKYLNFALLSLPDIPASFLTVYILKYFRRKKPLILSFILAGLLCVAQSFVPKDYSWLILILYFIGKVVTTITFSTVYIYTSELFPTYTRNSMHALCSSIGRIGSILAPMTPLLTRYMENLPTILFGICALVAGLITLLAPDIADEALPDNVKQAEGIGKAKKQSICDKPKPIKNLGI